MNFFQKMKFFEKNPKFFASPGQKPRVDVAVDDCDALRKEWSRSSLPYDLHSALVTQTVKKTTHIYEKLYLLSIFKQHQHITKGCFILLMFLNKVDSSKAILRYHEPVTGCFNFLIRAL